MTELNILSWALNTSIAVSILIAIVLLIRKPVARRIGPHAAYALWALPLLRLLLPALPMLPPLPNTIKNIPAIADAPTDLSQPGVEQQEAMVDFTAQPIIHTSGMPVDPLTSDQVSGSIALTSGEAALSAPTSSIGSFLPDIIIFLWLTIGALWFITTLCRQALVHSGLMNSTRKASSIVSDHVDAIAAHLDIKTKISVRIEKPLAGHNEQFSNIANNGANNGANGPLVTGIFNPIIILPQNFGEVYSKNEQHMTLMHECMHVRRRDLFVSLSALLFRALNWPNPIVHLAWDAFRADQEAACDASVLTNLKQSTHADQRDGIEIEDSAFVYASALVKSARHAVSKSLPATPRSISIQSGFLPSLSNQHTNNHVKERLMLIKKSSSRNKTLEASVAGIALIIGLGFTANYTHAAQDASHPETKTITKSENRYGSYVISTKKDEDGNIITETFSYEEDEDDHADYDLEQEIDEVISQHLDDGLLEHEGHSIIQPDEKDAKSSRNIFLWSDRDGLKTNFGHNNLDHNRFFIRKGSETVIMKMNDDGKPVTIKRNGDKVLINGKAVPTEKCGSGNPSKSTITLRLKSDADNGETEIICERNSEDRIFALSRKNMDRKKIELRALRSALASMEAELANSKKREAEHLQRFKENQLQATEKRKEAIGRLREKLQRLEDNITLDATEQPTPPSPPAYPSKRVQAPTPPGK